MWGGERCRCRATNSLPPLSPLSPTIKNPLISIPENDMDCFPAFPPPQKNKRTSIQFTQFLEMMNPGWGFFVHVRNRGKVCSSGFIHGYRIKNRYMNRLEKGIGLSSSDCQLQNVAQTCTPQTYVHSMVGKVGMLLPLRFRSYQQSSTKYNSKINKLPKR